MVVVTGAAVVDRDRTGTVDGRGEYTALAVSRVGVGLHGGVRGFA